MPTMTADQSATLAKAARFLRSNAASLRADREGAGGITAALELVHESVGAEACLDAHSMIRAAIKAYGQGNDSSAASCADTAAERIEAILARTATGTVDEPATTPPATIARAA
jgi:hypothetical protein